MRGFGLAVVLVLAAGCAASSRAAPAVEVDAPAALADQAVHVRATGLEPGARVVVELTADDAQGKTWRSEAAFTADDAGAVDLRRDAPADGGSYAGVDGMGLFWSLAPPHGDPDTAWFGPPGRGGAYPLRLAVRAGGREVAHRDLSRWFTAEGVTSRTLDIAVDGVEGKLFRPPPGAPTAAAVLLLSGSDGEVPSADAALFASRGHPALALDYFGGDGLPETLRDIPLEYLARGLRLLRDETGATAAAVTGYSRGSEAALLLAQHFPELVDGVVGWAPNDEAWPSFPDGKGHAWTLRGRPLSGAIGVDRVDGPVLVVAGGLDELWPAEAQARRLGAALKAAGKPHELVVEPLAGHGVGSFPYVPRGVLARHPQLGADVRFGGSRPADAAARAAAWPKALALVASLR
jgi:dienelactone hydrolase